MPKIFGKEIPTVVIGGMGVLAIVLAYTALVPAEDQNAAGAYKSKSKKSTTVKSSLYTEADYKIRFASAEEPIQNSFKPLVVRRGSGSSRPGTIPAPFTGGGNWVYTGKAQVNGVTQALLEDQSSGDAEFVQKGQRWKNSVILLITDDAITLSGPGGEVFTMMMGAGTEPNGGSGVTPSNGVAPVNVPGNLMGEIGGSMSVQPMQNGNNNNREDRNNRDRDERRNREEEE